MRSRAARGATFRGRRVTRAAIEALEPRKLLSVTNLIEGATVTEAGGFDPADPNGAVGPAHVVDTVNAEIQWFTKAGVLQKAESFNDFFGQVPGVNANTFLFDPHVIYDQFNNRFVLAVDMLADPGQTGDVVNDSHVLIAVSQTSDPNDGWYFQDVRTKITVGGQDAWLDYPGLAVSPDAVYLTGNMFPFSGLTNSSSTNLETEEGFVGSRLWIIPKNPLYTGGQSFVPPAYDPLGLTGVSIDPDSSGVFSIAGAERLAPAQMYAQNGQYPTGLGTFLTFDDGIDPATGHNLLGVIRVDNPLATQPTFTKQIIDVGTISTKNFHGAPQSGILVIPNPAGGFSFIKTDTNDERVLSAVWRNGFLYATQEVVPGASDPVNLDQVTAHWFQIATGTATTVTTATLFDQGNIGGEEIGPGVNTFFPAVSVNSRGDMAIGFSASGPDSLTNNQGDTPTGPNVFPSAFVTARLAGDPKGTVRPAEPLAVGQAAFFGAPGTFADTSRWGDYSGLWLDPSDDTSFWAFNMYAIGGSPLFGSPLTFEWGTRWGKFTPELLDLPAVGNFVWNDKNGNGIQDADEPGLAGVVFKLYDANGNLIDQTTSNSVGQWYFQAAPAGHLAPGSGYRIVADISAVGSDGTPLFEGYTFSPAKQTRPGHAAADDDLVDSDFAQSGTNPFQAQTIQINPTDLTVVAGQFIESIDLGLFKPFAAISPLTQTVQEGGPGAVHQAQFVVTLYTGILPSTGTRVPTTSPWDTKLYYSTAPVSAQSDVDFQSHTADLTTVPAGQTNNATNPITVSVFGDSLPEGNETFNVQLLEPSQVFAFVNDNLPPGVPPTPLPLQDTAQLLPADQLATVTILDDDQAVLSVDPGPTVIRGGTGTVQYALFTVRLSVPNPLTVPVRVNYTLVNGTATGGASANGGADFDNTGGFVEFAPGQLTKTIRVPVFGAFANSDGNETFTLVVTPATAGQVIPGAQTTATATIVDVGTQTISFKAGKSATFRDISGNMVTITLTGPGSGSVTKSAAGEGRQLVLDGTTEKSVLTIRSSRGQATFSGIQINGGLGALNGSRVNVTGSLVSTDAVRSLTLNYLTGGQIVLGPSTTAGTLITLNIRRIVDSTLTSETSIQKFNLGSWVDTGDEDFLLAPSIKTIRATGDFGASVQPTNGTLGTMTVNGVMRGSNVTVDGGITSIVVGSMVKSQVQAGTRIGTVTVRRLFSDSTITAPQIDKLDLGKIQNTTSQVLVAAEADKIGSVRWTFKGRTQRITNVDNPGPRGLDKDLDNNPQIILQIT